MKGKKADQYFYGHGKILLTGEYFIIDGAKSLALPTSLGQSLSISYSPSFDPLLTWKSYDHDGKLWVDTKFEFWRFDILKQNPTPEDIYLQKLLREARKLNSHFLRDEEDVLVEARLEFPVKWGLGSSSSLIYNIAQWAYVSPFELLFNTSKGSGYDIACSQSTGPIVYERESSGPRWSVTKFEPPFIDNLYFLYLGRKKDTQEAITYFRDRKIDSPEIIDNLSGITEKIKNAKTLEEFDKLILKHEKIISSSLDLPRVKELYFNDYWGEIKSLGAWGGDFVLVTSKKSKEETTKYFELNGFKELISFKDLVLKPSQNMLFKGDQSGNIHQFLFRS
ncbi:MAG: GYDIA family GHMP kinase [Bacteriovoracales bacterium]